MKQIILALLVAVVVAGCNSIPETPIYNRVTTNIPPTLDANSDVYQWDDSISHAMNFATIGDHTHGLQDRLYAEDAQRDVSRAEHVGTFLTNFAAGGTLGGAAARHTVTSARDASYKFTPFAIVLFEPEEIADSHANNNDGGFEVVFNAVTKEVVRVLESRYPGTTVTTHRLNTALHEFQDEYNIRSFEDAHIIVDVKGEACESAIEQRSHRGGYEAVEWVNWSAMSADGDINRENCQMFVKVTNKGRAETPWSESSKQAVRLDFNWSATWIHDMAQDADLFTWVLSTEWSEYYMQFTLPMPFVVRKDKAFLFTNENTVLSLSDLTGE